MDPLTALTDLAYEAAIIPEKWQRFLDQAAYEAGAIGGILFDVKGIGPNAVVSSSLERAWHAIISSDWADKNPLPGFAIAAREPGFMHDLEVLPLDKRKDMPWFTDFARQWALGSSLGTVLQVPNGNRLMMTFERSNTAPTYERSDAEHFNLIRPSIARAISLSAQLAFRHYDSTVGVLNALGLPSAVVSETGKLITCNALFEAVIPDLFKDRQSGLHLNKTAPDALLQKTFVHLRSGQWRESVASIPVAQDERSDAPAIIHVLPVRGVARDVLFGATGLVVVDRLVERATPSDLILRGLFDLTPAEARVAVSLLQHKGEHQRVSNALNVSRETVKTHSKAIYQKTGLSGVTELASILGGLLPTKNGVSFKD